MTRGLSEEFVWHVCEAVSSALAKCYYGLKSETAGAEYYGFTIPWTQVLHQGINQGNSMYHSKHRKPASGHPSFRPSVFVSAHGHSMDSSGTKLRIGASWNEKVVIKLGDFGTACKLQEGIPQSTRIDTEAFLAPVE